MFSMVPNFFRLHGYRELWGRSAQPMGALRGLQLVRFCPQPLESAPLPSLGARDAQWGGSKQQQGCRPGHASTAAPSEGGGAFGPLAVLHLLLHRPTAG